MQLKSTLHKAAEFNLSIATLIISTLILTGCGGGSDGAPGAAGTNGPGVTWVEVTGSTQQAKSNTGYLANNDAAQVVITLPSAPALGDVVSVSGLGAGGWKVAQNAGQSIITENIVGNIDANSIGVMWTARDTDRNWWSVASSADGTKLVAAVSIAGQLYTSTDSGVSWTARESIKDWVAVASSADGSKLVAAAYNAQLYTSTDSGVNWTPRDSARFWSSVASSADGTKLVAAENGGQLYTSIDSGVNWIMQTNSIVANWTSVASSADGTKLVAAAQLGKLYTSTDFGVNWTPHDSDRPWYSVASSADGNKLVAAAAGDHLYTSTDSGLSWTPRDLIRYWWAVASSADGNKLVAAENGGSNDLLYTSSPTSLASTTVGVTGSLGGLQYDAVDLQCIDANTFIVRSYAGYLTVQ